VRCGNEGGCWRTGCGRADGSAATSPLTGEAASEVAAARAVDGDAWTGASAAVAAASSLESSPSSPSGPTAPPMVESPPAAVAATAAVLVDGRAEASLSGSALCEPSKAAVDACTTGAGTAKEAPSDELNEVSRSSSPSPLPRAAVRTPPASARLAEEALSPAGRVGGGTRQGTTRARGPLCSSVPPWVVVPSSASPARALSTFAFSATSTSASALLEELGAESPGECSGAFAEEEATSAGGAVAARPTCGWECTAARGVAGVLESGPEGDGEAGAASWAEETAGEWAEGVLDEAPEAAVESPGRGSHDASSTAAAPPPPLVVVVVVVRLVVGVVAAATAVIAAMRAEIGPRAQGLAAGTSSASCGTRLRRRAGDCGRRAGDDAAGAGPSGAAGAGLFGSVAGRCEVPYTRGDDGVAERTVMDVVVAGWRRAADGDAARCVPTRAGRGDAVAPRENGVVAPVHASSPASDDADVASSSARPLTPTRGGSSAREGVVVGGPRLARRREAGLLRRPTASEATAALGGDRGASGTTGTETAPVEDEAKARGGERLRGGDDGKGAGARIEPANAAGRRRTGRGEAEAARRGACRARMRSARLCGASTAHESGGTTNRTCRKRENVCVGGWGGEGERGGGGRGERRTCAEEQRGGREMRNKILRQ